MELENGIANLIHPKQIYVNRELEWQRKWIKFKRLLKCIYYGAFK